MSARVVALPGVKAPEGAGPDAEVVEFVEAVLARAKSGELRAVAFVEVFEGDTVAIGHVNKHHYNTLTGGAARLMISLAGSEPDHVNDKPA